MIFKDVRVYTTYVTQPNRNDLIKVQYCNTENIFEKARTYQIVISVFISLLDETLQVVISSLAEKKILGVRLGVK